MNNPAASYHGDEIAIIGMTGRFPGAGSLDAFWRNLRDGVESVSFYSDEELLAAGVHPALLAHPNYVKAGSPLENFELFDATFFGFSPREAEIMDPQHRLFLECAWEALESAGYNPEKYPDRIGVYASASSNGYLLYLYSNLQALADINGLQIAIGTDKDHLATRVSYKLNLKGPSVGVQTTCSSSLVAVHLACQSLLNGECEMVIAGGATVKVPQRRGYVYEENGITSPDGHCRTFDAKARGTFSGNGVGVVVLKRLAEALDDGDTIHAVIKGSAVNNDGSVKIGYTAPSVPGQAEVIAEALAAARVGAETISYVEAHGTGTPLGDPIEIAALRKVYEAATEKRGFCAIGSVKTNIGHLDVTAGIAGLIKTVLALKHKRLPPSLHFEQANPQIDFAASPFYVGTKLSEWEAREWPRRAGVSSFGIGGTNAHVIVEEAPPPVAISEPSRPHHLLIVSAKTERALEAATQRLSGYLKQHEDARLADVAYTLQVGRAAFSHRRVLVCEGPNDAIDALETLRPEHVQTGITEFGDPAVAFMFPGQGAQRINMTRELYQAEPIFRQHVDHCAELLAPELGLDLRTVFYREEEDAEGAARQLDQTCLTQPALFVVEYALAHLWMAWGIRPAAMLGHSIGEYVAACLAGVFSLEDALRTVAMRGRLMQQLEGGAMLAIDLPESAARLVSGNELALAAINGVESCVVSGPLTAVEDVARQLAQKGVACKRLLTSHAFHSAMMQPAVGPFVDHLRSIALSAPSISFISNVTGTWITAEEATDPDYWGKHLRQTVRFADGLTALLEEPSRVLLEVGPGQSLSGLARRHPRRAVEQKVLSSSPRANNKEPEDAFLLKTLGQLWLSGLTVDWNGFQSGWRHRRLPLATYPFERESYWIAPAQPQGDSRRDHEVFVKKPDIADWFYSPSWKRSGSPALGAPEDPADEATTWLIFTDKTGLGSAIVEGLKREGRAVFSVNAGERFAQLDDKTYTINPQHLADYGLLLEELSTVDGLPDKVLHLWGVTPPGDEGEDIEHLEEYQYRGFYSLLFLAQALEERGLRRPLRLAVVSSDMQEVMGRERLCPAKATVLGACRVIPQEFRHITCCSIDLESPPAERGWEEELIEDLMAELKVAPTSALIAYRGRHRWVQSFGAVRLAESNTHTLLREGGTYLITGAYGGIGLVLAEHLARTKRAKLILVGRSTNLPAREDWPAWLAAHDEQDQLSQTIKTIQLMEAAGAEVLSVNADVTDLEQMREVRERALERFGAIHGVVHAAGVAGGGIIELKSEEMAARVMAPKVKGTLVLEALFGEAKLDFLLLCSSLNSILGGIGQIDYCAANAFLDAFAHRHANRRGVKTISVNFDVWKEVGMAVNTETPASRKDIHESTLLHGIKSEEGARIFSRILSHPMPQVLVSTLDFFARLKLVSEARASRQEDQGQSLPYKPKHGRPALSNSYVSPASELERAVVETLQGVLGIDQVGLEDDFFELGGDSLLATRVATRLRETFGVNLPLRNIFEAPTAERLSRMIEEAREAEATPAPDRASASAEGRAT